MKPITPEEARENLPNTTKIPPEFFEIINDIILEKFDGSNSFDITWDDIREKYAERDLIFPFGRELNFKPFYIKSGWDVKWIKESNAWEDGYDRYEFKEKI